MGRQLATIQGAQGRRGAQWPEESLARRRGRVAHCGRWAITLLCCAFGGRGARGNLDVMRNGRAIEGVVPDGLRGSLLLCLCAGEEGLVREGRGIFFQ